MTHFFSRIYGVIDGRERRLAYGIAFLVVAVCWVAIIGTGARLKSLDEGAFITLAQNLAQNGQYVEVDGVPTAYRAPGLVFFLTPFAAAGFDIVGLRLANATLIGFSLVLIYHYISAKASPLAGLIAVLMIPAWPVVIYAGTTLYPQTLAAFLLVLSVILIDRTIDTARLMPAVWLGLSSGALLLTIPIVLLLWPLIVIYFLWRSSRKVAHILVFTLVATAFMGSWTYRNYVVLDYFIPVATSSGYNLLAGNSPDARYNTSLNVRFPEYVYTDITGQPEATKNSVMTDAAVKLFFDDPGRIAMLYVGKFLHWFDYSNRLLSDEKIDGGASSLAPNTRDIILLVTYLAVIVLPLVTHIMYARRYPFSRSEIFFIALWICAGGAYAIFFTRVRFRLPFDWLIISSNAMFIAAVLENWMQGARKLSTSSSKAATKP